MQWHCFRGEALGANDIDLVGYKTGHTPRLLHPSGAMGERCSPDILMLSICLCLILRIGGGKFEMYSGIVVSGHCTTAGIAAALAAFIPNERILPLHMRLSSEAAGRRQLVQALNQSRFWLTSLVGEQRAAVLSEVENNDLEVLYLPVIRFAAFHPDCTYVTTTNTNAGPVVLKGVCDYHSAITFWAYQKGLSVERAAGLFKAEIFADLGYLDAWQASFDNLKTEIETGEISFGDFILPLMRSGIFMHTINHPRIDALVQLAKLLAAKMGFDISESIDALSVTPDGLAATAIWPVYPGIAESYGQQGSFLWKFDAIKFAHGPEDFVNLYYQSYGGRDLADYRCPSLDNPSFNRVLGAAAGI